VNASAGEPAPITIFLSGDVMTGRGIDQVLPHPSDPAIHEPFMKSAEGYVKIAEEVNGPVRRPVSFSYIWGDALEELKRVHPDARIINLETAVTKSDDYLEGKGINYRMNPANIPCITALGTDLCSLANNHVLDWGYAGLAETVGTLHAAGVGTCGAGKDIREAETPAVIPLKGGRRVVVISLGAVTSGIPFDWAATDDGPGVNLLGGLSEEAISRISKRVSSVKKEGDVVVASLHWGGNWGYEITGEQKAFAHGLIDHAGIDLIHGHSSHHVKGIEVYHDKLILYGCGDFIDDYEGIGGHEEYRADLGLMYFAALDPLTGRLISLRMVPTQVRRFSVRRASEADAAWLRDVLDREGGSLGTSVQMTEDNALLLRWEDRQAR
jgi:poly-gamma-glutamate capsule biosynthesis protein CapA/YwtB (metallophosphatase superfamily)